MRRYNLKVPMSLMLLLKTLVMVFDVAVRLDPKFSFGGEITPYLRKLSRFQRAFGRLYEAGIEFAP